MSSQAKTAYFFRTAFGSMWRSPFVHIIAIATLALALVSFGLARIVSSQVEALMNALGGDVEFTVYLSPETPEEKRTELAKALAARTGGEAKIVSPAEALERLKVQLGSEGSALSKVGENPLPFSIEIALPKSARDAASLKALAEKTRSLNFVSDVDYGEDALERLNLIARALRLGALVAFVIVFLTTVIIVSATLQLAIFSRREEIEIQKLVGGTDIFVRIPFLIEGVIQGVLAGALALLTVFAVVKFVESDHGAAVAFLRLQGQVVVDWPRLALEQFGIGTALGLLGSFIAVRRFLKV